MRLLGSLVLLSLLSYVTNFPSLYFVFHDHNLTFICTLFNFAMIFTCTHIYLCIMNPTKISLSCTQSISSLLLLNFYRILMTLSFFISDPGACRSLNCFVVVGSVVFEKIYSECIWGWFVDCKIDVWWLNEQTEEVEIVYFMSCL